MDTHGRRTAAVVAAFLLLTAALIAYNAVNAPPLTTQSAQIVAGIASGESNSKILSTTESIDASSVPLADGSDTSTASVAESSQPVSSVSSATAVASVPPVSSQTAQNTTSAQSEQTSSVAKRTTPPAQPDINLTTATAEELCAIPKIGPVLAGRIIEYRDAYGPLSSLEELLEVKGIGEKLYETLCQYLYLG